MYRYDDARRDVAVEPDEADLRAATAGQILRVWVTIGRWAASIGSSHPGWTVNGEPPGGAEALAGDAIDALLDPPGGATGCGGDDGEEEGGGSDARPEAGGAGSATAGG